MGHWMGCQLPAIAWIIVGLGLAFGFLNGMNDSGSLAAAVICTGAVGPRKALLVVAGAQLLGAMTAGVAVAHTVGQGIVVPGSVTAAVVAIALLATILWGLLSAWLGLPSSSSHALIGALAGATWAQAGLQAVSLQGIGRVLLVLFISPWLGFVASFALMRLLSLAMQSATPKAGARLERAQWLPTLLVAMGHGANDSQKAMGIIALGLLSLGVLPAFHIPVWLQLAAALAMACGTSVGGTRVMRTVGLKLYRMRAIHGFAAQSASAVVVLGASILGGPVSTSQVVGAGIAGAGSAQRFSQVRWGVIGNIVVAWLLTIPAAGGLAGMLYLLAGRSL